MGTHFYTNELSKNDPLVSCTLTGKMEDDGNYAQVVRDDGSKQMISSAFIFRDTPENRAKLAEFRAWCKTMEDERFRRLMQIARELR